MAERDIISIAPPSSAEDRAWLADLWRRAWGGETMVTRGRVHRLADLLALIAWHSTERAGASTYRIDRCDCELLSLNATVPGRGIGSELLEAVEAEARPARCTRLWLITSNDNLDALRFYQRRDYRLVAVHPGAIDRAREIKPTISLLGSNGIPIHDEIELEKRLSS